MYREGDTIAALASAPGEGGVAVVRMSGADSERILRAVFGPLPDAMDSHRLYYGHVRDGRERVDEAMAVLMRAPRSYTREDVAEIQCHGSMTLCRKILSLLLKNGARAAEPGEFTRRAFLSGRVDMTQAEAVMNLIGATNDRALREAMRQMEGGVSQYVLRSRQAITEILAGVEAATDFPDEVDEEEATQDLRVRIEKTRGALLSGCDARAGRIAREGLGVVLAGRPNAGKSSLMNALLQQERAIVTDIPGTTRDVLTEHVLLGDLQVNLTDTAGLREAGDAVERIGVERARKAVENADVVLVVIDASQPLSDEDAHLLRRENALAVLNKQDLSVCVTPQDIENAAPGTPCLLLSIHRDGEGVDALIERLQSYAPQDASGGAMLTQQRHIDAAQKAAQSLSDALDALDMGMELDLIAVDLRRALSVLGEITGETLSEDVIDQVFARFCVGK